MLCKHLIQLNDDRKSHKGVFELTGNPFILLSVTFRANLILSIIITRLSNSLGFGDYCEISRPEKKFGIRISSEHISV